MAVEDMVRLSLAVIASLTLLAFAIHVNDDWKNMSTGWRITRCSALTLFFDIAFASIEIMVTRSPIPLGIWHLLIPLSLIGINIGLWRIRQERSPENGGWIAVSEIERILVDVAEEEGHDTCGSPVCVKARTRLSLAIAHARHDGDIQSCRRKDEN